MPHGNKVMAIKGDFGSRSNFILTGIILNDFSLHPSFLWSTSIDPRQCQTHQRKPGSKGRPDRGGFGASGTAPFLPPGAPRLTKPGFSFCNSRYLPSRGFFAARTRWRFLFWLGHGRNFALQQRSDFGWLPFYSFCEGLRFVGRTWLFHGATEWCFLSSYEFSFQAIDDGIRDLHPLWYRATAISQFSLLNMMRKLRRSTWNPTTSRIRSGSNGFIEHHT